MTIAMPNRAHASETTRLLTIALEVIDHSGLIPLIEQNVEPKSNAGRKIELVPYKIRAMLAVLFEMMWSGVVISYRDLAYAFNFRLTEAEMELIGQEDFRDPQRIADMRPAKWVDKMAEVEPPADHVKSLPKTALSAKEVRNKWEAEYTRCRTAMEEALEPFNDNALPADRRHTNKAMKAAIKAADLSHRTILREELMSRMVFGSLLQANAERYPDIEPDDLLNGILRGWTGDLAIDETHLDESIAAYADPTRKDTNLAPACQLSSFDGKENTRLSFPNAIGLTMAMTVSRPDRRRIPTLATGLWVHEPRAAHKGAVLAILDRMEDLGLRPPSKSNNLQYVIADMAYPNLTGLNEEIIARRRGLIRAFTKTEKKSSRVSELKSNPNHKRGDAGWLYNGACLCPGISREFLARDAFDVPRDANGHVVLTPKGLHDHALREATLEAVVMPPHSRFVKASGRRPGRQPLFLEPKEELWKQRVFCPARAGKVRCPMFPPSMKAHEPGDVQTLLPDFTYEDRPTTCKSPTTTVYFTTEQMKLVSPILVGSWAWSDLYTAARAVNESYHATLIASGLGNLMRGQIKPRKNAPKSLMIAMAVAVTNLKKMESWDETLERNRGEAPWSPDRNNRQIRAAIRDSYDPRKDR